MKVSLMKQCISLLVFLFVVANCLAVPFSKGMANNFAKDSSLEQILFAVQTPTDIVSSMMQTNNTAKQSNDKKEKKDVSSFYECLLPVEITLPTISTISNLLAANISIYISKMFVADVEYPIKIPFLDFIFLLLILKLIFTMLKRSISINYNTLNIDRACIV